jgi:hypothetical protein
LTSNKKETIMTRDLVVFYLSRALAIVWFTGAILLLITIPACMYKIFSALWAPDDICDQEPVQEPYGAELRFPHSAQGQRTAWDETTGEAERILL